MRTTLKLAFIAAAFGMAGTAAAEIPCEFSQEETTAIEGNWSVCIAKSGEQSVRVLRGVSPEWSDIELDGALLPEVRDIFKIETFSAARLPQGEQAPFARPTRLAYTNLRARWRGTPDRLRCTRYTCYSPGWR